MAAYHKFGNYGAIDNRSSTAAEYTGASTSGALIDRLGWGRFQLKCALVMGLCCVGDSAEIVILSVLAPALHCEWAIGAAQQAMLTSVVFAAMVVSSSAWGSLCDKYGRKTGVLLSCSMVAYFSALSAAAPNYTWLLLIRALTGLGIAGIVQVTTLYMEFLPRAKANAGRAFMVMAMFWSLGTTYAALAAWAAMDALGWRWLLLICAAPMLAAVLATQLCMPESVRYLAAVGDMRAARRVLEHVATMNGAVGAVGLAGRLSVPRRVVDEPHGRLKQLLDARWRYTTVLVCMCWFAVQFTYYGIITFATVLYQIDDTEHDGTATGAAALGAERCALDCRSLSSADYANIVLTTVGEFPALLVTFVIIDIVGRKRTIAIASGIVAAATFALCLTADRAVHTVLLMAGRGFAISASITIYAYTLEVYGTTMRSAAMGAASACARLGGVVTPIVAQVIGRWSPAAAIAIYGASALLVLAVALLLPIETMGRKLRDSHFDK